MEKLSLDRGQVHEFVEDFNALNTEGELLLLAEWKNRHPEAFETWDAAGRPTIDRELERELFENRNFPVYAIGCKSCGRQQLASAADVIRDISRRGYHGGFTHCRACVDKRNKKFRNKARNHARKPQPVQGPRATLGDSPAGEALKGLNLHEGHEALKD